MLAVGPLECGKCLCGKDHAGNEIAQRAGRDHEQPGKLLVFQGGDSPVRGISVR